MLNQELDLLGPCGFLGIHVLDRSLGQLLPGSPWDTTHLWASVLPGSVGPIVTTQTLNDNDKDDGGDDGALEAQDAGGCAEGSGWQEKE